MTQTSENSTPATRRVNLRGFMMSIILNIAVPFLLYTLTKRFISSSEMVALSVASIFPIADSIYEVVRHKQLDIIALFALMGVLVSIIGIMLGGSPQLLLIRESFLTGAIGIACFVSLLFPRPLMYYIGRQMYAGNDPAKRATFAAQASYPYGRFVHRIITTVWGGAFLGEFILRVALVYTLPTAAVLVVSPLLLGVITVSTLIWTVSYVRYATRKGEEMQRQAMSAAAHR